MTRPQLDTVTINGVTLRPGQYFTVPSSGFVPWAIRTVTRAPVAHAVVYVGPQTNGFDCLQAQPHGVSWTRVDHWTDHAVYPMRRLISDAQSAAAQRYALTTVDWPYSYVTDALIGMRSAFGIRQRKDIDELKWLARVMPTHVECAQLADLVLTVGAGFANFDDGRLPGDVSPADLWRLDYPIRGH